MILLEGVDRTGKTTVARHLAAMLPGWSFVHQTKPPVSFFKYQGWRLREAHPRVIADRGHWSNYAYDKAYENGLTLIAHEWRLLELAFASRGTVVVYMHDELDNIIGRWGKDEMYAPDRLPALLRYYLDLVAKSSDPVSNLPCQAFTLRQLVNEDDTPTYRLQQLAAECEYLAQQAAWLPPPSLGFGTIAPGFLVVGEAPPDRCEPCGDVPRFPLDIGPAAGWLWRALDELEARWWEGYYTNASTFSDPAHFAAFVHRLAPMTVLGLGAKARDLIYGARAVGLSGEIRLAAVEHPMFVRRWRHRDFAPWKYAIGDALGDYCNTDLDYSLGWEDGAFDIGEELSLDG